MTKITSKQWKGFRRAIKYLVDSGYSNEIARKHLESLEMDLATIEHDD